APSIFSSRRRHTRFSRDWSSDVCSSDLELIHDNFVSMNTTMTRRRCFDEMGGFDSKDRLAEDYSLWLRFSTRYSFLYLPEVLGYYRVMENQISSDKDSRLKANERRSEERRVGKECKAV